MLGLIGSQRRQLLQRYGWYKNIVGSYVHPHCMDWMSLREIRELTVEQLEYKLQHGSRAQLPSNLRSNS